MAASGGVQPDPLEQATGYGVPMRRAAELWRFEMWKIVAILLLTLTVVLLARLVYKAPMVQARVGLGGVERMVEAEMPKTPPFIYAGIRG
jgi:hypothetical protein